MDKLSQNINEHNLNSIKKQIELKKGNKPFLATTEHATGVITDHDVFPYPRYFRGIAISNIPVVAEREAGWRNRNNDCRSLNIRSVNIEDPIPSIYFQTPANTVIPYGSTCTIIHR